MVWALAWLPTLSDTVFAIGSQSKKVTRLQGVVGPWISCVMGVAMLGCGATAVAMMQGNANYYSGNKVAAVMPTFPYIFQPIVLLGLDSPPTEAANVFLWIVNAACDSGTGIANLTAVAASTAPSDDTEVSV